MKRPFLFAIVIATLCTLATAFSAFGQVAFDTAYKPAVFTDPARLEKIKAGIGWLKAKKS